MAPGARALPRREVKGLAGAGHGPERCPAPSENPDAAIGTRRLAPPLPAHHVLGFAHAVVELAAIGVLERLADPARELRVRRLDLEHAFLSLDPHDAFERVLLLLALLHVPGEVLDLLGVSRGELARDPE